MQSRFFYYIPSSLFWRWMNGWMDGWLDKQMQVRPGAQRLNKMLGAFQFTFKRQRIQLSWLCELQTTRENTDSSEKENKKQTNQLWLKWVMVLELTRQIVTLIDRGSNITPAAYITSTSISLPWLNEYLENLKRYFVLGRSYNKKK